jgi:2-polyprenyl-6-methoxyphenol hydroxylase-like FAD-dependent oxidoreductase
MMSDRSMPVPTEGSVNGSAAQFPSSTDVLIVGGGPAGLAAAIELGRRGIACVIIEPRTTVDATRPRAKTTSTRTMEHFRRWGIADRLRAAAPLPVSWSQAVIFADSLLGEEITRFSAAFGLRDRDKGLSSENGQQVPQPVVEEVLRATVRELETVTFLTGYRVTGIEQSDTNVRATIEPLTDGAAVDGATVIEARYLLGCDGSSGVTRRAIGASYQGSSNDIANLSILFRAPDLGAQVHLDPAVQYWIINPDASGLMGRLDLGGTWWAIVQSVTPESVEPLALVRGLLGRAAQADDGQLDIEVIATDPWHARLLLVDRYRSGRVFLVGDAAHLNPPWGGHGFNTCIGDAVNIGWKLAAVLQGWGGPDLLDSYEAERRPVAAQTIADAGLQEKLLAPSFVHASGADATANPAEARARLAAALQGKHSEFSSAGLVLGYHYAGSPVLVDDGTPVPEHDPINYHGSARPGARLPHVWVRPGRSIHDELGDRFTLLLAPGATGDGLVKAAEQVGVSLATISVSAEVAATYGASLVLVRPDQHVAWRGESDDRAAEVLETVTGGVGAPVLSADAASLVTDGF